MKKTLKIKSTHRPCLVTTPSRSKTLIVAGTIVEVNGEEWNHPYCAIVPGGVITLDDIEWEYAYAREIPKSLMVEVYKVQGSKGDTYTVKQTGDKWTCDCPHYDYRKQICKHIKECQ
jgi:ribosomal protein S4